MIDKKFLFFHLVSIKCINFLKILKISCFISKYLDSQTFRSFETQKSKPWTFDRGISKIVILIFDHHCGEIRGHVYCEDDAQKLWPQSQEASIIILIDYYLKKSDDDNNRNDNGLWNSSNFEKLRKLTFSAIEVTAWYFDQEMWWHRKKCKNLILREFLIYQNVSSIKMLNEMIESDGSFFLLL